ncbi:MFS transporter [Acididesulfobacillus acetoxydans]|uniref:MFS transporter n=1 Tax=Acididesulfobacillus acetoxydans TaxID=1561005 RepID=UPI001F0D3A59|nr:MFS transporter [Acididesulfobacillus acetoxydans]
MAKIELKSAAKRLVLIRGLRSLGQGAMVVDLTLYLKALNWSGAAIGGVTSAAGLAGAALILMVGILSDRKGRKPFLLIYEFLTITAAVAASITTHALVLVLAIVVAGFGRGQSGAAGPFSPAEQAWLARLINPAQRGLIFSLNNAVGFIGMAVGAVIGGIPALFPGKDPLTAYRPVFLMVGVVSVICMLILLGMREDSGDFPVPADRAVSGAVPAAAGPGAATIAGIPGTGAAAGAAGVAAAARVPRIREGEREFKAEADRSNEKVLVTAGAAPPEEAEEVIGVGEREKAVRKQENASMLKLALVNALNGLAIGLTGPMMAYWFNIRYGVSPAAIGMTLSVGYLLTGISSVMNGFLAQRVGVVKSVTWMRVLGSILMLTLPWMPNFALASVIFVIRNAINRGTTGNRFALSASLTRDRRRGLATSINALSMRLPSSIGPGITGYLFDMGFLSLPLYLTATLQLVNAAIFQVVFGRYDKAAKQAL